MPWSKFIFTKQFWLTERGKPDFLGYSYMSAGLALCLFAAAIPMAFFDAEIYALLWSAFFMLLHVLFMALHRLVRE